MTTCPSCNAVYDLVRFHAQSGMPIADTHTVDAAGKPCRFAGQLATAKDAAQAFFARPQQDLIDLVQQLQAKVDQLTGAAPAAPAAGGP